jgi:hypothetical protein
VTPPSGKVTGSFDIADFVVDTLRVELRAGDSLNFLLPSQNQVA